MKPLKVLLLVPSQPSHLEIYPSEKVDEKEDAIPPDMNQSSLRSTGGDAQTLGHHPW